MSELTTPADELLEQEFSYTTWDDSCKKYFENPSDNNDWRACRRPHGHDGNHASGWGFRRLRWQ